ncbi:hypothetical protein ACFSTA_07300 [Ornithinibacillus salinisoli]|uniref:Uncharacterized protein n=1 Tax=Ornithinibacillus salinisoli TaxID=1848459 RepID=A0ABW4VZB3_9BACI
MYIVTAQEMYDMDHYTMSEIGLRGRICMENAGRAVCEKLVHNGYISLHSRNCWAGKYQWRCPFP